MQALIEAANADIKAALRSGDMDRAWMLISRKVGWLIVIGAIMVRLKKPSKAALYG